MPTRRKVATATEVDRESLLERVLTLRPNASLDEIRRLAPPLRDVGDRSLMQQIVLMKPRLAEMARR